MGDALYARLQNIDQVRNNALIMSSGLQVGSRVWQANRSAQQTQNTQDGPYRYMEAVKTTFREVFGFLLSFAVLRHLQRITVDVFRNALNITTPLPSQPTMGFNRLFRRIWDGPDPTQLVKAGGGGLRYDESRMRPWLQRGINGFYRLRHGVLPKNANVALTFFLEWFPILLASVPALLLSGYALERYSQLYAEPVAKRIAQFLGNTKARLEGQGHVPPLDPSRVLPYAGNQPLPFVLPGAPLYGNLPVVPGFRSQAPQQFGA